MLKKLQVKFVAINMLIVAVMLGVIFGLIYFFTEKGLEQSSLSMLQNIAENPFRLNFPGEQDRDVQLPYFILMIDEDGELVASGGGYYDLTAPDGISEIAEASLSSAEVSDVLEEYNLRFLKMEVDGGYLIAFADISSERATLNNLLITCGVIGILSFLVFLIISIFLAKWAIRPVAEAWRQQRQFLANVSHELKTPLTVISTNAEIVLDPVYDEKSHRQCAENILAMSVRMRALVKSLLELARADLVKDEMEMKRLDFGELLKGAVLPFEAIFYERGLKLVTGIQTGIYVKGSEKHLEEVAEILLDNAQKYALPTAPVYLKLWQSSRNKCCFSVSNASEPLTQTQLKDIFKRFYRVEEARCDGNSYGLGLPIAQMLVSAHRGKMWASYENGTITFLAELPICR